MENLIRVSVYSESNATKGKEEQSVKKTDTQHSVEPSTSMTVIERSNMMIDESEAETTANGNQLKLTIKQSEFDAKTGVLMHERPLMIPDNFANNCMVCSQPDLFYIVLLRFALFLVFIFFAFHFEF